MCFRCAGKYTTAELGITKNVWARLAKLLEQTDYFLPLHVSTFLADINPLILNFVFLSFVHIPTSYVHSTTYTNEHVEDVKLH